MQTVIKLPGFWNNDIEILEYKICIFFLKMKNIYKYIFIMVVLKFNYVISLNHLISSLIEATTYA